MELIINRQDPGAISCNYEELKTALVERVEYYKTLVYTDDQIKAAKEDRANLNRLKTQLKDRLKEVEREFLAPFETFRSQINELVKIIDDPVQIIDRQIKEVEEAQKTQKRADILAYYDSVKDTAPEWLSLERIENPRWLNKTFSMKDVKEEISGKLDEISRQIETLNSLPEFGFEALEEFKRSLDINRAIAEGHRLADIQKRKAEEETRRREAEEERRRIEADAAQTSFTNDNPIENTPEIQKPITGDSDAKESHEEESAEKWIAFEALLNTETAHKLADFMKANGIRYRKPQN